MKLEFDAGSQMKVFSEVLAFFFFFFNHLIEGRLNKLGTQILLRSVGILGILRE